MCWNTIKVRFRIACQAALVMLVLSTGSFAAPARTNDTRPNILLAISDDQSWLHTGAAGDPVVKTPAFDRIASEGVQFTNAYCAAPYYGRKVTKGWSVDPVPDWHEPNMCIHSDPFFGDLEPGESRSADGKLIIFTGSLEQFEKKSLLPEP